MTGGKKTKKNRAFMPQLGTKYDTSPVEGREKEFFIGCSTLNTVIC